MLALNRKTPREMKLDKKGGLLAMLTKDGIADFTNYLAEVSVTTMDGRKVVYSSATLQKKASELSKASRIARRLIKDGYVDDANKSLIDNYFTASRREGALENAMAESQTRVSVYQKLRVGLGLGIRLHACCAEG